MGWVPYPRNSARRWLVEKLSIRLKSGQRIKAPATPTSNPLMFVTPERRRTCPGGRSWFAKDGYALTHKPTGIRIADSDDKDWLIRLAAALSRTKIPWKTLRTKADAKPWKPAFTRALRSLWIPTICKRTEGRDPSHWEPVRETKRRRKES